jgi:hypothetical protein
LVHAGHQRRQCQRNLHLEQQLPAGRAKRLRGLDRRRVGLADAQAGQANRWRDGIDQRGDYSRHARDAEE